MVTLGLQHWGRPLNGMEGVDLPNRTHHGRHALGIAATAILFAVLSAPHQAQAQIYPAANGMFLCPSPVTANDFWTDVNRAASTGVKLTHAVGVEIATRNGCHFVQSKGLKPVRYVAGELGISDGSGLGWTAPELYIVYINEAPAAGR